MYASLIVALCLVSGSVALNNGLGQTPQMGWNSWNHFACGISEELIKGTADALILSTLTQYGYNYVNMDDCWALDRDPDNNWAVRPDPNLFPSGIRALADYVHSKGLKFGLYSDSGALTCAGRPGSLTWETVDATTYANWTVDYLKFDNCYSGDYKPEIRYPVMRDALLAQKYPIFFSLCEWGVDDPALWAPEVGNSWRTTYDISDHWDSMLSNLDLNDKWAEYAGPGGWNDPDMLEVGNGGMTDTEYTAHFSLWCLIKAPLLIGCDITNMSATTLKILTNSEAIAVNQDSLGVQGRKTIVSGTSEVWFGPLSGGRSALILFNRGNDTVTIEAPFAQLNLTNPGGYIVRDLWAHQDVGTFTTAVSQNVESHGVFFALLTPKTSQSRQQII